MTRLAALIASLACASAGWPCHAADGQPPPRFSQVRLLTHNGQAWQAKRELIAQAQDRLDLSYFILEDDETTATLMKDLAAAAGRQVEVRLLVDYFLTYRQEALLQALARIKNIEVRRYRPPSPQWLAALRAAGIDERAFIEGLTTGNARLLGMALAPSSLIPQPLREAIAQLKPAPQEPPLGLALRVSALWKAQAGLPEATQGDALAKLALMGQIALGLDEFLHRTHHKLLLADRHCFIMGGRNLADAYQRADPANGRPFQDTDLHACDSRGIDSEHVKGFRTLWYSGTPLDAAAPDATQAAAPAPAPKDPASTPPEDGKGGPSACPASQGAKGSTRSLPDMDGDIVNNLPSGTGDGSVTAAYIERIQALAASRGPDRVIDIVSAYVLLGDTPGGSRSLQALRASLLEAAAAGVTVNIYTNSISTTDLKLVNTAAYPGLVSLIEGGVHVFELACGQGTLHTKAAAIGHQWLMVGSYNMDPRSELYDTNNLIVLHDQAGKATSAFRDAMLKGLNWIPLTLDGARRLAEKAGQAPGLLRLAPWMHRLL